MIGVNNLILNVGFSLIDVKYKVASELKISIDKIKSLTIIKQSIDARRKPNIKFVLNVGVELFDNIEFKFADKIIEYDNSIRVFDKKSTKYCPIIIGFGPSGMFSALMLSRMGLNPIVVEQGEDADSRIKAVEDFWSNRNLNKYSNVQFGEGGAGTFSDGKLNTNLSSKECKQVINELYYYGAPKEILYVSKAHIGTDNLRKIVVNIREDIIKNGGKVLFSTRLVDFEILENNLFKVNIENVKTGKIESIISDRLILAVGHSARDVFHLLKNKGVELKQKPFAMGVRIEQNQEDINTAQYGVGYDKRLPNADYKLVTHLENGRSVFTFCMCPGGFVVASSSNENEIVTNGMSNFKRDNSKANSAVLVNVKPEDFGSEDVLAGVYLQEKYERMAFELGGSNYNAPCECVETFCNDLEPKVNTSSTYRPSITPAKLKKCLPNFVYESLKTGLKELNRKMKNFAKDDNLLIGVETRSSCPLTIVRDDNYQTNISGIYPIGEGAGYAGGIVSSALDGIKLAEKIYSEL